MKRLYYIIPAVLLLIGCSDNNHKSDAYGSFEATEIMVSSEANGKLVYLDIDQGEKLFKNELIAIVDTTLYDLQMEQLEAQKSAVKSRYASIDAQIEVLKQQIENLKINLARVENMLKTNTATQKQYDDLEGKLKVLKKQIAASNTQRNSVTKELGVLNTKRNFILEQKIRCKVFNPENGTVLEKYSEQSELTAAGKPLYKIANLNEMTLKVYASASQVNELKIGNKCKVLVDQGSKDSKEYEGIISQIADQAEFTPKIIQTKEVRVNLVYAVKIRVQNDGFIRIGMPGEAMFN